MAFVKRTVDGNNAMITLGNGLTCGVCYDDITEEMQRQAGLHGLKQKLGDGTSSFSRAGDYDGAFAEVMAIRDSIMAGVWNRKGAGTSGTDLLEALSIVAGKTLEEAEVVIAGLDETTFEALRKDSRIVAAIKTIQADRAKAKAAGADGMDLAGLFS